MDSVSLSSDVDRWVWRLTGYGDFTVSSTCSLVDQVVCRRASMSLDQSVFFPVKVNILALRISRDFLPTCMFLSRRGMEIPSLQCSFCDNGVDSVNQLLFLCPFALAGHY